MLFYIARRLVWTLVVVAAVIAITFAVFYLLPAGDPALRFAGKNPNPAELQQIRQRLGLDQAWYIQFGRFTSTSSPATSTAGRGSATRTRAVRRSRA